jgi:hypothetical protein
VIRHPWYIRFWQRCMAWSITLEGELVWWSSDDIRLRKRRLDHELRLSRALFRPICWLSKDGHSDYYGYCVVCDLPMSVRTRRASRETEQPK